MSYEQFADDAAAVRRALEVERAEVMGYSQGGRVALQLALRHPTLVNKLVSLSATYRRDSWYPSVLKGIAGLSAKEFAGTPVEKAFMEHTPDAKAFDSSVEKMKVLNIDDQNISDAQMRSISAETMVIVGDGLGHDVILGFRMSELQYHQQGRFPLSRYYLHDTKSKGPAGWWQ
jgi:pimeloyl-ACP methyl ester carboxylesterase